MNTSKTFRSSNNYLVNKEDYIILFEDELVLTFYRDQLPLAASTSTGTIDRYPGDQKFAQDLLNILVNEYHFNIVPDRKGRTYDISPSPEGTSIYFDAIYDLTNVNLIKDNKYIDATFKDSKVGIACAVEIRISDHDLNAGRASDPDDYAKEEVNHIKKLNPNVDYTIENQQGVTIKEYTLQLNYRQALEDVRGGLRSLINRWTREIKRRRDRKEWSGAIKSI